MIQKVRNFFISISSKSSIASEFIGFLWAQKLWWMIPMLFILVLLGFILVMSHGSVLAPFIYTLF